MKQDQEVAVEVSNRVMKSIPSVFADRSTTDLSQTIRIEQAWAENHFEPAGGNGQSSASQDTRIRVEFLGKIHLTHAGEPSRDRPAYKTRDGHTLH